MAPNIPFDTHAYVKKLRAAGVPEAQAEVQAQAFAELINDQLATKRDLAELELRLSAQLKELELRLAGQHTELEQRLGAQLKELELRLSNRVGELELRLKELELRIVVKLGAIVVAGIAALAALEKFF